jgi:hypothetical protein
MYGFLVACLPVNRALCLPCLPALKHAWEGYTSKAWGTDELKPQSGGGQNNWGGVGMTLVDSLDTLWIMGMKVRATEGSAFGFCKSQGEGDSCVFGHELLSLRRRTGRVQAGTGLGGVIPVL